MRSYDAHAPIFVSHRPGVNKKDRENREIDREITAQQWRLQDPAEFVQKPWRYLTERQIRLQIFSKAKMGSIGVVIDLRQLSALLIRNEKDQGIVNVHLQRGII